MTNDKYNNVIPPIFFGKDIFRELQSLLLSHNFKKHKKIILVDENTLSCCWPILEEKVPALDDAELIEIVSGEKNKNLDLCSNIWLTLSNMPVDRHAVLINFGGGVISDLGGFVASCYKRGIKFINIPTTLLSQIDASIGGKTGVDLNNLKNQVGLFSYPEAVFVYPTFLNTLGKRQLLSGYAEMLKHALIADNVYWGELKKTDFSRLESLADAIQTSIMIKKHIVSEDPYENGIRKLLNFGHTIGHAIETNSLENQKKQLFHGEAVAIGMICESFLSYELLGLPLNELEDIVNTINLYFPAYNIKQFEFERIIELIKNDKKNLSQQLNFTLLTKIGIGKINIKVTADQIIKSLNYYRVTLNA